LRSVAERIDQDFKQALAAQPVLPKRFLLYFETGGVQLTAESQQLLPQVLDEILLHPAVDISVIGHTDTAGDAEKNQELGLSRAQAVADLLVSKQIKVLELTVSSHGESNLLVPTPDNTPEPLNRLVEISVR
jgi:peptidoglycan-associated lipoprotein